MESGNLSMIGAAAKVDPSARAYGGAAPKSKRAMQLGIYDEPISTDYGAHFVDYREGKDAAQNPYTDENRVHEVDPSAVGGKQPTTLRVTRADGTLREISRVPSAIDLGHDDYFLQSQYMAANEADRVWLTRVGGWKTHTVSFVPALRPKFAANKDHPAAAK